MRKKLTQQEYLLREIRWTKLSIARTERKIQTIFDNRHNKSFGDHSDCFSSFLVEKQNREDMVAELLRLTTIYVKKINRSVKQLRSSK